jgi:hypothetical protein
VVAVARRVVKVIVILCIILFAFTGKALSLSTIMGYGNSSCGTWLEQRRSLEYDGMKNWALGYLSGAAAYTDLDIDPLRSVDANAIIYWLDN